MRVTSHQEDKLPQTSMRKLRLNCGKKENLKRWKVPEAQNLFTGLRNHCVKQQKENQLVITEKNNETNQNRN